MEVENGPSSVSLSTELTQLPQKKYYRQRAHANPMSDHDIEYPVSPKHMNWSLLLGDGAAEKTIEFADIGCGYGGLLMRLSPIFPNSAMVGMEIRVKVSDFVQDKIKALRAANPGQYDNVCCIRTNAMKYLPNYFGKAQLAKMFFLFPDPHFKKVKHKWRIISPTLLAEYAFVLRPGGRLYTITDVEDLHEWMVSHITAHPLFRRLTNLEMAEDIVVGLLYDSTEEGQKVWINFTQQTMSEFSEGRLFITNSDAKIEIDYEGLAPQHKLWVHLAAGGFAGAAEHCVMFPLDSVKTRLQSLCPCPETSCPTPLHGVASIARREGWRRPLRGVNAVAIGAVPAHALYFTVYEKMKVILTGNTTGYFNTMSYAIAGATATVFHDLVMNPVEVVKQRMQMMYSPYGGSLECVKCIYKREGIQAFYRSYATQLLLNVPFQAIHFMTYEFVHQFLNPASDYNPKVHLLAGAVGGGMAAAVTTPLDCVKTVLNTQQDPIVELDGVNRILMKAKNSYSGFSEAVTSIYANRGFSGFMRGVQARVIYQMPATGLSWSIYELFKYLLSDKDYRSVKLL